MVTLALDLGTCFGWSVFQDGIYKTSGYITLKSKKFAGKIHEFHSQIKKLIKAILKTFDIGLQELTVVYEHVIAHSSSHAAHLYGAFLGIIQLLLSETTSLVPLSVTRIKKVFTGRGNCGKQEMVQQAVNMYPYLKTRSEDNIRFHNEADAIAINYTYWEEIKNGKYK
jgi:Holliday junction resolvasome RuvABC endonuclease subunit